MLPLRLRLFGAKPALKPETPSGMEKLPAELYAQLLQYTTPTGAVLLSLTCKKLWSQVNLYAEDVLYQARRCAELSETIQFLTLLEKDNRGLILCTACLKLHQRRDVVCYVLRSLNKFFTPGRKCSDALGTVKVGKLYAGESVTREAVELILRAASLGPRYGLSVKELNLEQSWEAFGIGRISVNLTSEARAVIAAPGIPCLVLKTTQKAEIDLRRPIDNQIESSKIVGCNHETTSERRHIAAALEEVAVFTASQETVESSREYRCAGCPTDMRVLASKHGKEVFARLQVQTWRDLGPRGDHGSQQWQAQSAVWKSKNFDRTQNGYLFGVQWLGSVYDTAKQSDSGQE